MGISYYFGNKYYLFYDINKISMYLLISIRFSAISFVVSKIISWESELLLFSVFYIPQRKILINIIKQKPVKYNFRS
jgi:hypothetical protein